MTITENGHQTPPPSKYYVCFFFIYRDTHLNGIGIIYTSRQSLWICDDELFTGGKFSSSFVCLFHFLWLDLLSEFEWFSASSQMTLGKFQLEQIMNYKKHKIKRHRKKYKNMHKRISIISEKMISLWYK